MSLSLSHTHTHARAHTHTHTHCYVCVVFSHNSIPSPPRYDGREHTRVLFLTMERNSPEVAGRVLVTGSDTGVGGGDNYTGVTCGRVRDHGPGAGFGGGWLGHGPHSGPGGKAGPVAVCRHAPRGHVKLATSVSQSRSTPGANPARGHHRTTASSLTRWVDSSAAV